MTQSYRHGIAVAPHAAAADAAVHILREGGNAIEAMVAAAATIAVVYPHMTAIGGDAFWLIHEPGKSPIAIDACGAAAQGATLDFYKQQKVDAIPIRGPLAANTVAGTISGWDAALEVSKSWRGKMPLSMLMADAIGRAREGIVVTRSQHASTSAKLAELSPQAGFADTFLIDDKSPEAGSRFALPRLANTLEYLAKAGLQDFYRGDISQSIAKDLSAVGSPLTRDDLTRHQALYREPLTVKHTAGNLYNMTPPTQGVVSLLILAILDKLGLKGLDPLGAEYVHLCVEATKQAFAIRDKYVTDPAHMSVHPQSLLDDDIVAALAMKVKRDRAAPWGKNAKPGDTVWMGVIDGEGRAVSFIQSIYHEFGTGIVLKESGINWQNRGASFSLDPNALLAIKPGKKPFHTLNPALALFSDGRVMPYGTMGGDGQPQTQCAVFTRIANFGMSPQDAIAAPRWLLGRTWGNPSDTLKLESRFDAAVFEGLRARGHDVEALSEFDESVGHAGALIRTRDGNLSGGFDPRSDGGVTGF
ncbi:MAG: gamma-glutamyltransferase family protein [Betaproteobacteria bacterium]|nr:gamma-glutamyltransferase family protein [Betaproteobacteria bacterium]